MYKKNSVGRGYGPLPPLPTSMLVQVALYTIPLMMNAKQGSCKYYPLKSFDLTRRGNQNKVE